MAKGSFFAGNGLLVAGNLNSFAPELKEDSSVADRIHTVCIIVPRSWLGWIWMVCYRTLVGQWIGTLEPRNMDNKETSVVKVSFKPYELAYGD